MGKDYEITLGPHGSAGSQKHSDTVIIIIFFLRSYCIPKWLCQDITTSFSVFSTTKLDSEFDLAAAETP